MAATLRYVPSGNDQHLSDQVMEDEQRDFRDNLKINKCTGGQIQGVEKKGKAGASQVPYAYRGMRRAGERWITC